MKKDSQVIFDRNVIEFVTVAAEFCKFVEQAEGSKRKAFVDTTLKLLPLLYLKASMLPPCETIGDEAPETFVTEETYEIVRMNLADILADRDDYLDVFVSDMKYSDQPITRYISEDLADIYQDIRDFIFVFQLGLNETMNDSLAICQENFRLYWGQKLVNTLRALHEVKYGAQDDEIIKRTIAKEALNDLPKAAFPGQIHVVQTPQEAERAAAYLKTCPIVGIDTETRPSFSKGRVYKVALLQVSSEDHCFLFRLNQTGLTMPVIKLLESPAVTKVGLSLRDDFMMLHKRAPFEPRAYVELQEYVRPFGIEDKSLQKIYGILFNEKISKSQRLSNWEAETLTQPQQLYAATDAWACLNIYHKLQELKETGDFIIEN